VLKIPARYLQIRHKRVRYHNDAVLFPDDSTEHDRKRRKHIKKLEN
jgi:hypothetical protein